MNKKAFGLILGFVLIIVFVCCTGFKHNITETNDNQVSIEMLTAQDGHEYVIAAIDTRSFADRHGGCSVSIVHAVGCSKCKQAQAGKTK